VIMLEAIPEPIRTRMIEGIGRKVAIPCTRCGGLAERRIPQASVGCDCGCHQCGWVWRMSWRHALIGNVPWFRQ